MGLPTEPRREMKVLALGLPRTGTLSMAEALTTLGYENVHHTLKSDIFQNEPYNKFCSRAADAIFPALPTYTGGTITREDWDTVYGTCEAVTESAAFFAPQLIRAYPKAKVVVVVRDFDRWFESVDVIFSSLLTKRGEFFIRWIEPILGLTTVSVMQKGILGFFEANDILGARENAEKTYNRHHRVIQEMVSSEQLLFYRMGDGWEPLCKFLGKPVPDSQFPRVNDSKALTATGRKDYLRALKAACWVVLSRSLGFAAIGISLWVTWKKLPS
ncbi:nad dependent epimerase [Hirsutella rhossiliensis]|uniref:Nad dependent epimerase n=1 Tax=Hirsutella rhossiliensis TaxID=111463 RepID=A0A9P8N6L3_9HYPO|nr:nad dependent epimerase [Hirsutella rhossiliensis]KAH0966926.1 nad dependent epimerase [Hirsutella rhossiliensis]